MMEDFNLVKEGDQMDLPPGFRFHPTDEELISHYLCNKVFDNKFCAEAIGEVDMNRIEPWELPRLAKMGEKEWYFFCLRDKKYPTGMRTNRATAQGYWKATGKDRDIFRRKLLVGMKKTLVFYKGRAPKGEKTNWVVHEYRLEGKSSQNLPKSATNEWVIIRVFHKNSSGNKVHISELVKINSNNKESLPVSLPQLIDYPMAVCDGRIQKPIISDPPHVPCFSNNLVNIQQKNMYNSFLNNPEFNLSSNPSLHRLGYAISTGQCTYPTNDHAILRGLIQNYGENMKLERDIVTSSQDTGLITGINNEFSSTLFGAVDMDCFWNQPNLYEN